MLLYDAYERLDVTLLSETRDAVLILRRGKLIFRCFEAAKTTSTHTAFYLKLIGADLMSISCLFTRSNATLNACIHMPDCCRVRAFILIERLTISFMGLLFADDHLRFSFIRFIETRCASVI